MNDNSAPDVSKIFAPFSASTPPAMTVPAEKKTRKRRVAKSPALAAPYKAPNPPIQADAEVNAAMHQPAPAAKRARKPRTPKVTMPKTVIMLDAVMLMEVIHGMDEATSGILMHLLGALQAFPPKQRKQLAQALQRLFP